jgi:hypothetical protein
VYKRQKHNQCSRQLDDTSYHESQHALVLAEGEEVEEAVGAMNEPVGANINGSSKEDGSQDRGQRGSPHARSDCQGRSPTDLLGVDEESTLRS